MKPAEGLRAMASGARGEPFPPHSRVRNERQRGRLVSAVPEGSQKFQLPMDVLAYREKPTGKDGAKSVVQALWSFLQSQAEGLGKAKAQ